MSGDASNSTNTVSGYDEYLSPMFTDTQTAVLELLPYATAPFSVIGSSLILRYIWFHRGSLLKSVFHRLMLCISILDFICCLSVMVLGPWVVPEAVGYTMFGRGTIQTCTVAGFFLNFVFGTMWYSSFLSLYFLFVVVFEWKEVCIACCFEPLAHLFALGNTIWLGIVGVQYEAFNPMRNLPGFCWFHDYPPYCSSTTLENAPDCIRGETYSDYSAFASAGTMLFLLGVIVVSMTLLVCKVRRTEGRLRQYAVGDSVRQFSRTKETANQAMLYIASFLATFFPIMMLRLLDQDPESSKHKAGAIFSFALLTKAITPMQGLFTAYIYLHKQFWKNTREKQCFGFLRKTPWIGKRVSRLSNRYNTGRNSRRIPNMVADTTTATATGVGSADCEEAIMFSSVVLPPPSTTTTTANTMAQTEVAVGLQDEKSKVMMMNNQQKIMGNVSHLSEMTTTTTTVVVEEIDLPTTETVTIMQTQRQQKDEESPSSSLLLPPSPPPPESQQGELLLLDNDNDKTPSNTTAAAAAAGIIIQAATTTAAAGEASIIIT